MKNIIYPTFDKYWQSNKIVYPVGAMEDAFREIAEKAWNSVMESAKQQCIAVAMTHQKMMELMKQGRKVAHLNALICFKNHENETSEL